MVLNNKSNRDLFISITLDLFIEDEMQPPVGIVNLKFKFFLGFCVKLILYAFMDGY